MSNETQDGARWQVNSVRHETYSGNNYEKPARVTNVPFFSHPVHGRLTLDYLNTLERDKADLLVVLEGVRRQVKHGHGQDKGALPNCPRCKMLVQADALIVRVKEETR